MTDFNFNINLQELTEDVIDLIAGLRAKYRLDRGYSIYISYDDLISFIEQAKKRDNPS